MLWQWKELAVELESIRSGQTVALANGCFDLFHVGHVGLFETAGDVADIVVVALDGDERVRALKGEGRPAFPLWQRAEVVAACRHVSYVTWFHDLDDYQRMLAALKPDVLVKGEDYREKPIVGWRDVLQIVFAPVVASSSAILGRINLKMAAPAAPVSQSRPA